MASADRHGPRSGYELQLVSPYAGLSRSLEERERRERIDLHVHDPKGRTTVERAEGRGEQAQAQRDGGF
jgi:hypothetical protein